MGDSPGWGPVKPALAHGRQRVKTGVYPRVDLPPPVRGLPRTHYITARYTRAAPTHGGHVSTAQFKHSAFGVFQ